MATPLNQVSQKEQEKFKKIKELTLAVIKTMDNDKMLNYKRYETFFKLCEQDFDMFRSWDVLHNTDYDSAPYLLQLPFEEVKMRQIQEAAKKLGIELENYIYYRHTGDPEGIRSKTKVPCGYVHIKRVSFSYLIIKTYILSLFSDEQCHLTI